MQDGIAASYHAGPGQDHPSRTYSPTIHTRNHEEVGPVVRCALYSALFSAASLKPHCRAGEKRIFARTVERILGRVSEALRLSPAQLRTGSPMFTVDRGVLLSRSARRASRDEALTVHQLEASPDRSCMHAIEVRDRSRVPALLLVGRNRRAGRVFARWAVQLPAITSSNSARDPPARDPILQRLARHYNLLTVDRLTGRKKS
jgi:hypothetical protein